MTKIAFIDNSIDHVFYNPVINCNPCIKEFVTYRAINNEFPSLNENFTHIILSGSEYSILEKAEWISKEIELIKKVIDRGIPILGSCFGHQLITVALCGYKNVRRRKNPEVGWIEIKIYNKNSIFRGINDRVYAFSSHFDEVFDLPPQFNILASSASCDIQAFQYLDKPVWGIQFHPEINIEQGKELLYKAKFRHIEYTYIYQRALNSPPRDSEITQKIVNNFLNYY